MKTRSRFIQYALKVLLITLQLLGIYLAWVTYQYETIVKGVMGITIIYLFVYYLKKSGTDLSLIEVVLDPKIYGHIIFAFIGPIIALWATVGILDMVIVSIKWLLGFF